MKRTFIIIFVLTVVALTVIISTNLYAIKSVVCEMPVRVQGLNNNAGITVKARDYEGGPIFTCITDSQGQCVITGLTAGLLYKVGPAVSPTQSCPTVVDGECGHESWYVFQCTESGLQ